MLSRKGLRPATLLTMFAAAVLVGCSEQPLAPGGGDTGATLGVGTIGDFVWHDLNENGIQDSGEPGIPGVTVTLVGSDGTQTMTTDANGMYLFEFLGADTYTVTVTPPSGMTASPTGAGTPSTDSNPATSTVILDEIVVFDDLTIDWGFYVSVPDVSLTATKTATGSYDRTITWDLAKSVTPTTHNGVAGGTAGSSTWTVVATKSAVEGNYSVTGSIVVSNANDFDADFSVTDQLSDGTNATVSCPTSTVPANGSVTCTYVASPTDGSATSNTATVSSSVGGGTATAPVSFTANVIGSETADLADPRFSYSTSISTSSTVTFPETFPCPSNSALYVNGTYTRVENNVATLTFGTTTLTRNAAVTITCVRAWGDETAVGAGIEYPNSSNWFMYTPYTTSKVNLIAGQHFDAGDIFMSRSGSTTTIKIVLHAGYRWADVEENLKIQPFDKAPKDYVQPGAFRYKFDVSGTTITVTMPGTSAKFYGIHGDVERLLP